MLGVVLGVVALVAFARAILDQLLHEPRLYLVNRSFGALDSQTIRSACGVVELPALAEGQSSRLNLVPRSGCRYEINNVTVEGYALLRLIEFGRKEKADVEIEVGFNFVTSDLTTRYRYRFW